MKWEPSVPHLQDGWKRWERETGKETESVCARDWERERCRKSKTYIYYILYLCVDSQTDRQTDRQTSRQAGRQAGRQADGEREPYLSTQQDCISGVSSPGPAGPRALA